MHPCPFYTHLLYSVPAKYFSSICSTDFPILFSARGSPLAAAIAVLAAEAHALRDLGSLPLRRRLRGRSPSSEQCRRNNEGEARRRPDAAEGAEPLQRPRFDLEDGQGERRETEDL